MITSVDDLLNVQPQTQTIELSSLNNTTPINIDSTNGLTGVAEPQQEKRPVIKINSLSRGNHRTITSDSDVNVVDPTNFIPKPVQEPVPSKRDKAMSELENYIDKSKKEYQEFLAYAEEKDRENRQKIEDGLEEAKGYIDFTDGTVDEEYTEPIETPSMDYEDDDYLDSVDEENEDDLGDFNFEASVNTFEDLESPSIENIPQQEMFFDNTEEDVQPDNFEDDNRSFEEETVYLENKFTPNASSDIVDQYVSTATVNSFEMDEEDATDEEPFQSIDDEELSDEEIAEISKEATKEYRNDIIEKIVNAGRSLNTSQFVVSHNVISIKEALQNSKKSTPVRIGSWPMMNAGRPFTATPLKGSELALLVDSDDSGVTDTREEARERTSNTPITKTQAKIVFEHDANPYKPSSFEEWCKTIPYWDYSSLFGALYVASLDKANYIPRDCMKQSCQRVLLTDQFSSVDSIINFSNDEIKDKFNKIKDVAITPANSSGYTSVVSTVNDKFAIGIKPPSLYTALFELDALDEQFADKYSEILSIIYFIDYIYFIDADNGQLRPIGWKTYPGNYNKTFKSKISTYSKIIKDFDERDFTLLQNMVKSAIVKDPAEGITFRIPETKCPKCGSKIEATDIDIRYMLFMRQQLVTYATLPTEN